MSRSLSSHDAENIIGLLQSSSGEYQTEADWSQSRSALSLAAEVLHPNTGWASRRTGLHGRWVGGEECEGGLCAGLIILSTEWAHITKDLLSLAGELLQTGNSVWPLCLPGDRKMWPSSASVGRFKQQQTLSVVHKAASVSGRIFPFTGPHFAVCVLWPGSFRYSRTLYLGSVRSMTISHGIGLLLFEIMIRIVFCISFHQK